MIENSIEKVIIKDRFNGIRSFISLSMVVSGLLSLGYLIFWLGAISDEMFLEYGSKIFQPLAMLLNFGDTSVQSYINTSGILFCAIFALQIVQIFFNKQEEYLIDKCNIKEAEKIKQEKQEAYENYMARFDSVDTFSICLSIDYENNKKISYDNKNKLNKVIYLNIAQLMRNLDVNSKIIYNNVLIFTSTNFAKYDFIYDSLLKELSKIKQVVEKKYGYNLVPSITTDAFSNLSSNNIQKQHFEIQSFNFKNRALVTASFANKYKHLRHNKYAGVPIGEYVYFDKNRTDTFELNVVYKNLSKALAKIV